MNDGPYIPMPQGRTLSQPTLQSTVRPSEPIYGNGAPEGVVFGNPGQNYQDTLTGNWYVKVAGTTNLGWLFTGAAGNPSGGGGGGGGGTTGFLTFDGNPNGIITATGKALLFGVGSSQGQMWVKVTPDSSNTDWIQMIA